MARPWLPFLLPFALFLAATALEGRFGLRLYPVLYGAKIVLTSLVLLLTARHWRPLLRLSARAALLGALAGAVGLFLWLALDRITPPLAFLGKRTAFDPTPLGAWQLPFLAVRFFGLALLVPFIEEVFWRGFLLRWVSDADGWQERAVENFTPLAALIVSTLFAAAHPEWLAALAYGLGLCALLKLTRSLLACLVCHAITNLLLGVYVLLTRSWHLW